MVAANYADRNYTTVTFSPPGIKVSGAKYNFDYSTGTLFNRFFIVKPDKDIVPQIDVQKGTVMDIPCYLNALPCHGLSNTINTLATSCGDPAGRRINETT
ncbi:hypothetical protein SARC_06222 [Sphaeroforma arctica JP610]|uniref:Uncharacterized protein n=1 Tax=Sphaeroforma arctica JP610 TaxID=667725 RepID=A0A0L0FZQ6_9EUKA|nr:hypothetical protein SARC_06222 [Sphaeroforma arctica JP610]KNC81453.1 hypothetical protein SARC_06222 [Sphaeroforma arctica JP610]|eukprot:XP_014155355.1 hypothetical protein SARC_06222 [Sphaeroforma arctica JP610]